MASSPTGPLGGFHINVQAPKITIRDELGRFTSAQRELYQQNRELATTLRYQVARRMKNNLLRPGVSTGRLVRVTMDPKNSGYNSEFMGVGDVAYLDKSIARYWRTIEEGSAATWTKRKFTSLPLQGLWGMNTSGWHGSGGAEWAGVGSPRQRGGRGQEMYHPFRKGRGGGPSPLPIFYPKHDIRPMHAYADVSRDPDLNRRLLYNATKFWNHILGAGIQPRGFRGGIYDHGAG